MDTVGISVQLGGYKAVVHYTSCAYWKDTYSHLKFEIPPSIKWRLCKFCNPTADDIVSIAGEVRWLEKYADAANPQFKIKQPFDEELEAIMTRKALHGSGGARDSRHD